MSSAGEHSVSTVAVTFLPVANSRTVTVSPSNAVTTPACSAPSLMPSPSVSRVGRVVAGHDLVGVLEAVLVGVGRLRVGAELELLDVLEPVLVGVLVLPGPRQVVLGGEGGGLRLLLGGRRTGGDQSEESNESEGAEGAKAAHAPVIDPTGRSAGTRTKELGRRVGSVVVVAAAVAGAATASRGRRPRAGAGGAGAARARTEPDEPDPAGAGAGRARAGAAGTGVGAGGA